MKVRWTRDHLRLRITPRELEMILEGKPVIERFQLSGGPGGRQRSCQRDGPQSSYGSRAYCKFAYRVRTVSDWLHQRRRAYILTTPETRHCTFSLRKTFPALTLAQATQWKSPARRSNLLRASKRGRPLSLNHRRMPLSILIIGGSDAGISAALRAHELDASARIAVVLAGFWPTRFPILAFAGFPSS
jgi:hypothetical protein